MKLRKSDMIYFVFLNRKLSSKRNYQSMKKVRPENYEKEKKQIISTGTEKADKHEKDR